MPKASPKQESFNGGQIGPFMRGRISHPKYETGAQVLEGWWPTVQGAAVKRPGTRYVKNGKYADKFCRLVEFEFSVEQTYVLEFGDAYMRVLKDDGMVTETAQNLTSSPTAANPVQIGLVGHGYLTGDEVFITGSRMIELNDRFFTITKNGANTFLLNGEDGTGRNTGLDGTTDTAAKVYEIALPYLEADLRGLQFAQLADVLYVASKAHPPRTISRTGDAAWSSSETEFDWPAFRKENDDEAITVQASAATGAGITLTASSAIFTQDMVGSYVLMREVFEAEHPKWVASIDISQHVGAGGFNVGDDIWYETRVYRCTHKPGNTEFTVTPPVHEEGTEEEKWGWQFLNYGKGYAEITSVNGPGTIATCDVVVELPASVVAAATDLWSIGAWNDEYGYPGALTFYDDRLYFAGTEKDPQTFWGSFVSEYKNFRLEDKDDAAVQFTLNVKDLNRIDWMAGEDVLFMGTKNGEFIVTGPGLEEPISGSAVPRARRRSKYGTKENVAPIGFGSLVVFAQTAGKKVMALQFQEANNAYVGADLTRYSDDVVDSGLLEIKAADEPYRQLVAVQIDGVPAFCTISTEEDVLAWSPCPLGGTDAKVESVAVVPHPDGDRDRVWASVSRTVNGSTIRHIEYFEREWRRGDAVGSDFYVDAGLVYESLEQTITNTQYLFSPAPTRLRISTTTPHGLIDGDRIRITEDAGNPDAVGVEYITEWDSSMDVILKHLNGSYAITQAPSIGGKFKAIPNVIRGLQHLEGESVAIQSEGAHWPSVTVTDGTVDIGHHSTKVTIGLPYAGRYLGNRPEAGAADGTAQGKTKRITRLVVRVDQTGEGLKAGPTLDGPMEPFVFRTTEMDPDAPVPKKDGDTDSISFPGGYSKDGQVALIHDTPLSCTLLGVYPQLHTQDR